MTEFTPGTNKFLTSGIWLSIALDSHLDKLEKYSSFIEDNIELKNAMTDLREQMQPFITSLREMLGEHVGTA